MNNIKYYAFPSSVADAMNILLNRKYKALVMAGGTLVGKAIPATAETYLDIRNLPLKDIKVKGGKLVIGAAATFDDIDNSELCREWAGGILSQVASQCSSQLIRNMATIGGNIARPHSFNMFPVVLMCMGAEVMLETKNGKILVPYASLSQNKNLKPGENCIILEVLLPKKTKTQTFEFIKLAKTKSSWESYVTLCFSNEKKNPKFVVGALTPRPFCAVEAEKAFAKGATAEEILQKFTAAIEAVKVTGYRAEAATNLLRRYLGAE